MKPGEGRRGFPQHPAAGMIHARKIVTVTAEDHSFHLDGETAGVVPRTTSSEIHRYKACTAKTRSGP